MNDQLIAELIAQGAALQPKMSREEIERQAAAVTAKALELAHAMDEQIAAASSTPSPTREFLSSLSPDFFFKETEHGRQ